MIDCVSGGSTFKKRPSLTVLVFLHLFRSVAFFEAVFEEQVARAVSVNDAVLIVYGHKQN